jgi:uroporphyrinogen decarboxylase
MIEGGTSRNYVELKRLLWGAPDAARMLLDKLTRTVVAHLVAQVAAGAQAVQLFDTWAGVLSPPDFDEFALPAVREIIAQVHATGVPVIYFVNGSGPLLDHLQHTGADVIGLDWKVDLRAARERLGPAVAVQGNLDPAMLFAPADVIARRVRDILARGGGEGHIFNLGHGVLPDTPISGVEVMVRTVRTWAAEAA